MSNVWVKIKTFSKTHFILTIGVFWLLIVLLTDFIVVTMDLQYDDSGLGTILILGDAVYGFPFWLIAKMMPLKMIEVIHPYLITLLLFVVLDLLVSGIIQRKKRSKIRKSPPGGRGDLD